MSREKLVGRRVRAERETRGLSQRELGERLGDYGFPMIQATVAKLEGGSRPLRIDEADAIAQMFNLSLSELLNGGPTAETDQMAVRLGAASETVLADRLGRERRRRGWSQERLAKEVATALGRPFPQSSVSKLERGPEGRIISAAELVAFGRVFEVDPLALMLPDDSFEVRQAVTALDHWEQAVAQLEHAALASEEARLLAERSLETLPGVSQRAFWNRMQRVIGRKGVPA